MTFRIAFAAVAAAIALSSPATATDTPLSQTTFNGHLYSLWLAGDPITWEAAEAEAITLGGHLASIGSADENAAVFSLIGSHGAEVYYADCCSLVGPWIGGYRVTDGFAWTDGTPFTYSNFAPGEPNNASSNENWLELMAPGISPAIAGTGTRGAQWNDLGANSNGPPRVNGYIIEIAAVPEPAAWMAMIVGFGAIGAVVRRRRVSIGFA